MSNINILVDIPPLGPCETQVLSEFFDILWSGMEFTVSNFSVRHVMPSWESKCLR